MLVLFLSLKKINFFKIYFKLYYVFALSCCREAKQWPRAQLWVTQLFLYLCLCRPQPQGLSTGSSYPVPAASYTAADKTKSYPASYCNYTYDDTRVLAR